MSDGQVCKELIILQSVVDLKQIVGLWMYTAKCVKLVVRTSCIPPPEASSPSSKSRDHRQSYDSGTISQRAS